MTLIAAWKTPGDVQQFLMPSMCVLADSQYSGYGGSVMSRKWLKVRLISPQLHMPQARMEYEDELFYRWRKEFAGQFAIWFAGSSIPYSFVADHLRQAVENLYVCSSYIRRGKLVQPKVVQERFADAIQDGTLFRLNDYQPKPKIDLACIANLARHALRLFYAESEDHPYITNRNHPRSGELLYPVEIGLGGWCESSGRFRLFKISPVEKSDSDDVILRLPFIEVKEIADGQLFILGAKSTQAYIENLVDTEIRNKNLENVDPSTMVDEWSAIVGRVIHTVINSNTVPGVGGQATKYTFGKTEVRREY